MSEAAAARRSRPVRVCEEGGRSRDSEPEAAWGRGAR
jgi:hypothetical protein